MAAPDAHEDSRNRKLDEIKYKTAANQLRQLRTRLLDLGGRSKYINFTHSEVSRSQIRIVDASFENLFDTFTAGLELSTRPLTGIRPEALDADSFLEDETGADASAKFKRARILKPELVAEQARSQGVNPSFELREIGVSSNSAVRSLQTLLSQESLDRKLSGLYDESRRYQQEMGVNALFGCFGFLEWYEAKQSGKKRLAPLILVPTEIRRQVHSHRYEYRLAGAGDEIDSNVALIERLRSDFGLDLPQFSDDESPILYLEKIESIVRPMTNWKVHGFATVSILNFSKVAMYNDLSQDASGFDFPLHEHSVIADLLGGTATDLTGLPNNDVVPDNLALRETPLLVTDADFSQFAAVTRALEPNNLVIEGPPGTGKSQTITNIIAAALAKNETVLFLAEKLAALEIVKQKLDHFGLGDFVFELHSTKSRKSDVIESLKRRLSVNTNRVSDLDKAHVDLVSERTAINEYLDALHQDVGNLKMSLHEAIWKEIRLRDEVRAYTEALDKLHFGGDANLTQDQIRDVRRLCDTLEDLALAIRDRHESIERHPWYGTFIDNDSPENRRGLLASLHKSRDILQNLRASVSHVNTKLGLQEPKTVRDLDELIEAFSLLSRLDVDKAVAEALDQRSRPALWEKQTPLILARFLENLSVRYALLEQWGEDLHALVDTNAGEVEKTLDYVLSICDEDTRLGDLQQRVTEKTSNARAIEQLKSRIDQIVRLLEIDEIIDAPWLLTLNSLAKVASTLSDSAKAFWSRDLADAEFRRRSQSAINIGRSELDRNTDLHGRFDFTDNEDPRLFRDAGRELRTAGVFWFLKPRIHAARRLHQARSRGATSKTNAQLSLDLINLADALDSSRSYSNNLDAQRFFGQHFRGIHSPFDSASACLDWSHEIATEFEARGRHGAKVRSRLFTLSIEDLATFVAGTQDRIFDSILAKIPLDGDTSSLDLLSNRLRDEAASLAHAMTVFSAFNHPRVETLGLLKSLINAHRDLGDRKLALDGDGAARSIIARNFEGSRTNPEVVRNLLDFAEGCQRVKVQEHQRRRLSTANPSDLAKTCAVAIKAMDSRIPLKSALEAAEKIGLLARCDDDLDLIGGVLGEAISHGDLLEEWLRYCTIRSGLTKVTGDSLPSAFEASLHSKPTMPLSAAFEYLVMRTNIIRAFSRRSVLSKVTGLSLEAARKRFAELDSRFLELSRSKLAHDLSRRAVDRGNGTGPKSSYTGGSLIGAELAKQKRHLPIRELVRRSGLALQQLKPCWMMSPLSVAQYIEGHSVQFDLIVIDEASQMLPEDAIGALARGKRVVVVGDQKQLPPTSFFARGFEPTLEDIEEGEVIEAESILNQTMGAFGRPSQLRVHYRSNFESLIAFSNEHFYDGSLVIFPSPENASGKGGVRSHYIGGTYKASLNLDEGQALIDSVMAFMRTNTSQSCGIVAMNYEQREYINEEIERRIATDSQAADYVAKWEDTLYPFFVKNLESVQGDERDAIFISTVYGPETPGGKVAQRFGPILGPTGWRRLNVLFTRARQRIELFTSMRPSDIPLDERTGRGVTALRNYLEYAETGRLSNGVGCRREPESDFEIAVARALTQRGFEVDYQIGVAHCFIDLGIRDPRTGTYILGVECDGASYHRSRYARDRDRIREEKLRLLGWNLYRIWSTDWFANPEREIDDLATVIHGLLAENLKL